MQLESLKSMKIFGGELFLANKDENIKEINHLIQSLDNLKNYIQPDDEKSLKVFLRKARKIKEGLDQ